MLIKDNKLLMVNNGDIENDTIYVPFGIREIGSKAFYFASKAKKIVLPSSVLQIHNEAFYKLRRLEELQIGNYVHNLPIRKDLTPNLSRITFDCDISDDTLEEINAMLMKYNGIKNVKILYRDYYIGYNEERVQYSIGMINKLKTDRFEIGLRDSSYSCRDRVIIDKEQMVGYNVDQVCKEDKYFDYLSLIYEGRYDAILDWERVMEHHYRRLDNKLPSVSVIKSIPTNDKCIKEFLMKRKKYEALMSDLKLGSHQTLIFNRLLYFIGYFDGDSKYSKQADAFIEKITKENLKDVLYYFDFLKNEVKYNKHFVPVLFDCWDYIYNETEKPANSWNYNIVEDFEMTDEIDSNMYKETGLMGDELIGNLLIKQIYDCFDLIYKESLATNTKLTGKNVVDLLSKVKYVVRPGNQDLFDEISKYLADYSVEDFNRLQDIYDQAKEIYKNTTKKIKQTIDTNQAGYSYSWLEPLDPKNFTLGHRANCCARLNHAGEGIMVTSVLDPSVSNLAIQNKEGKVIAKATAYYNEDEKYIYFNNVEVRMSESRKTAKEIYRALQRAVKDQVRENQEINDVVIGMAYNDLGAVIKDNCEQVDYYDEYKNNDYRDIDGTPYVDYSGNHKQFYLFRRN